MTLQLQAVPRQAVSPLAVVPATQTQVRVPSPPYLHPTDDDHVAEKRKLDRRAGKKEREEREVEEEEEGGEETETDELGAGPSSRTGAGPSSRSTKKSRRGGEQGGEESDPGPSFGKRARNDVPEVDKD